MVKYTRIQYRDERKEYRVLRFRESGPLAESPGNGRCGKVRPGAKSSKKVINESGTASILPASCTDVQEAGF